MAVPAPDRDSSPGAAVRIRIRHGADVPLRGAPQPVVGDAAAIRHVALCGADYVGLRPGMLVQPGDRVRAGQPLFVDRRDPAVKYTAPGMGIVAAVHRGPRRSLDSIVVRLDEGDPAAAPFGAGEAGPIERMMRAEVVARLAESGLWTALRARPFGRVPLSGSVPAAIFVTAIDTEPLAGDPRLAIRAATGAFQAGLRVLARLTEGTVWLCTAPGWDVEEPDLPNLRRAEFGGPHPAGLAGTHVHYLSPVRTGGEVWHIGSQDVMAIGTLFADGVLDYTRTVALGGEPVRSPRLVRARLGAALAELVAGELDDAQGCCIVSGSPLSGRAAPPERAFLGRYHAQVSAVRVAPRRRRGGWFWSGRRGARVTAASVAGPPSGMLPLEIFEGLLAPGFLAVPLLRALMAGDVVRARELGCLELDEEDLALCAFACPARCDYRGALSSALQRIEKEG